MTPQPAAVSFQVHSEARGPHWVAWLTLPGQSAPYRSVLVVGASKEEAETRAREWGAQAPQSENRSASSSS
jgi:hypothetical protein